MEEKMKYSEWKELTDGQKMEVENFWMEKMRQALFLESYERAEKELLKIREWKNRDAR